MPVELTKVVIIDDHLYTGTGMVHRWLGGITGSIFRNIFIEAPVRSGELRGGLHFDVNRVARRVVQGVVESTAPHTLFVIEGTAAAGEGYIYSSKSQDNPEIRARMLAGERVSEEENEGMWMAIHDGRGPVFHLRVKGQKPNNFMLAGYNRAARSSRSLHPIFPGFVS